MEDTRLQHPFVRVTRWRLGQAWRWRLAGECLHEVLRPSFDHVDQLVRQLWLYRRQIVFGPEFVALPKKTFEMFCEAEGIQEDRGLRENLMVLVLGGCSRREIAQRYGWSERLIATWESMFFDVRDSRWATDWLASYVIEPERCVGNVRLVVKLRMAMQNTPEFARLLVDAECRPPIDEAERKKFEEIETSINGWVAVNLPFKSEMDALRMMRLKQRLDDIDRRIEAQRNKAPASSSEQYLLDRLKEFKFPAVVDFIYPSTLSGPIDGNPENVAVSQEHCLSQEQSQE